MLIDLLTPSERMHLGLLVAGVGGVALFETFAVGAILPFVGVLADPSLVDTNPVLAALYEASGAGEVRDFLFLLGLGVLGVILVGNTLAALITWRLFRFVWGKHHDLSVRLLGGYLQQPYVFFLSRNTADLGKKLLAEVTSVTQGILVPGVQALTKSVLTIFVFALLLYLDPMTAVLVGLTLGTAYAAIYFFARRTQIHSGEALVAANSDRFRMAAEALQGIKPIKVSGRSRAFLHRFSEPSRAFADASVVGQIVPLLPRYALEVMAFGGVLLILLLQMASGDGLAEVLPIVSLYAFAGYKLMPALQQVFQAFTAIRFNVPALRTLHVDLMGPNGRLVEVVDEAEGTDTGREPFRQELRLENVGFTYPGVEGPALSGVSLILAPNETIGIAGSTGSGKTTLVDVLLGLLRDGQDGSFVLDGQSVGKGDWGRWRAQFGYVPQEIFLVDDSIRSNIALGVAEDETDDAAVERAARAAGAWEFIEGLPDGLDTVVGERGVRFSGGQRQRIGIARALYDDPPVLVLDEATSALDGVTEDLVMEAITRLGDQKSIVIVAHRLSTLRDCVRIYLLEKGRLRSEGSYDALVETDPVFRRMAESYRRANE